MFTSGSTCSSSALSPPRSSVRTSASASSPKMKAQSNWRELRKWNEQHLSLLVTTDSFGVFHILPPNWSTPSDTIHAVDFL